MKKLFTLSLLLFTSVALAAPQLIGDSTTTWELTENNTVLTIGGTGAMPDFEEPPPWYDDRQSITTVIIESDVTSIGGYAFFYCSVLKSVTIPESVMSIVDGAFDSCTSLESVSAPSVTSIGEDVFSECCSLTSVYVPSVTSIGWNAFGGCGSLTSLTVNSAMQSGWDTKKSDYGIDGMRVNPDVTFYTPPPVKVVPNPAANSTAKVYTNGVEVTSNPVVVLSNAMVSVVFEVEGGYCFADDHSTTRTNTVEATNDPTEVVGPDVVKIPLMSVEVAQQAEWGGALMSGDLAISAADYANACVYYGISPKTAPQIVQEGEIAVTKESIQAAKAETVQIVNGQVALGVSVCSNADITASTANWAPVKFTKDTQIGLSEDGTKLILPIPVAAQQGFMILQSGDAKVSEGGARVPVTGEPWYKPTVED